MNVQRHEGFDVIVVGAGVVGCAMAALLIARKVCTPGRVALVAQRFIAQPPAAADWDLRVFALSRAAEKILRLCGVWQALPSRRRFAYERMCVWDGVSAAPGSNALRFDCAEIGEPNLGTIVDGGVLQWECLRAVRAAGVQLIESGIAATSLIAADPVAADREVTLADGRRLRTRLLIAADGPKSATRALLGIESAGHAYQQDALVAHVRSSEPHRNTAWQRFLPGGPIALLPLADGRSSIVWSAARAEAARLRALDPVSLGAAVSAATGNVLGECVVTSAVTTYPLQLQYALEYLRPRAVLIGDAAHVVHPLAGQGLNLGLLDCASLAQVLADAGGAGNFGDTKVLRRYERWRRSENLLAAAALDGLQRVFSGGVIAALPGAALNVVGKLPFAKRGLARRALGLAGDLPEFLRTAI